MWLCFFLYGYAEAALGQRETGQPRNDDKQAIRSDFSYGKLIIPTTLMVYGSIEVLVAPKCKMLNYAIGHEVIVHTPKKFQIDDITQYVPVASVYALNLAGIKGKNSFKDRTAILGISALLTTITVNSIKYTVGEERPDKSALNSFPSGHTATAFMGAEFLWQEYKDISIWYGMAGYAVAAVTGVFRIYNNKHWVGDIAFGAGLGILCTKSAYWLYPVCRKLFSKNRTPGKNITLLPYYNGQQTGLFLSVWL
ncbi:MAG: phosphatase PAP2 family protein [Bacteroidales bacterium]|jgi:hypothetical protein|nr:phosphatase PAP2 family protein [Bacteroidales bacterium]